MQSLKDRVVFITGASAGIGEACARAFAPTGARLLLAARRLDRVEVLARELHGKYGSRVHCFALDVRDREAVNHAIAELPDPWAKIEILVNNAGLSRGLDKVHEADPQDWEDMIDTNVKGLLWVTRAVLPGMVERRRGHIINIGSIAGHEPYTLGSVYCATKAAVRAITDSLRQDVVDTPLRVSEVDPGLCETEFSLVRFHGDAARASKVYEHVTPLTGDDVAEAVLFVATRPPHVTINELVIMPTAQAKSHMLHRDAPTSATD